MVNLDDKSRLEAEQIIKAEITAVNSNLLVIKGNGCAACHVLFKVKQSMGVSEQDAADLLSEMLLDYGRLNDDLITWLRIFT